MKTEAIFNVEKKILELVIGFLIFAQHINSYSRSVVFHWRIFYVVPFEWNTAIQSGRVWLQSEWMQFLMRTNLKWTISTQIIYLEAGIPVHQNTCYSVST